MSNWKSDDVVQALYLMVDHQTCFVLQKFAWADHKSAVSVSLSVLRLYLCLYSGCTTVWTSVCTSVRTYVRTSICTTVRTSVRTTVCIPLPVPPSVPLFAPLYVPSSIPLSIPPSVPLSAWADHKSAVFTRSWTTHKMIFSILGTHALTNNTHVIKICLDLYTLRLKKLCRLVATFFRLAWRITLWIADYEHIFTQKAYNKSRQLQNDEIELNLVCGL